MDPALLARAESALSKARAAVDVEKRKAALFGSIAGKGTMADDLIKLFPPHKTYTEVFAGGAAVFWSKDPSDAEVLNDFNPEVAHAYQFAQRITDEQIAKLRSKNWIGSKELFKKLRDSKPTDPLERFYRLIYLRKAGFARGESACAPDKIGKPVASTIFDRLPQFRERLKGVRIYSGDFMKPLTTHDGPDTLHFMDPPFPGFKFNIGEGEWDEERFLKVMYALKGKFVLTYETRSELNNEFRKRGYRVREWLPKENRGFNPNQEGRQKTTVVTNFERKLNKVFQVPDRLAKKLSPKQREDYERESALINENRKKPEADKAHDFEAANWTHPNGHPRCLVCGQEEPIGGRCNDRKAQERALRGEEPTAPELTEKRGKPLSSPGGKDRLVPDLLSRLPDHQTYVEPYAGSASLFWAKEKSEREVLSDVNADIIGVFKFLRDASDADLQWMRDQDWKKSRSTFDRIKGMSPSGKRERAYRTKYLTMYSTRSDCQTFNASDKAGSQSGDGFLSRLESFRDRLKGVELLAEDAIKVIAKFDGADTFFYVDPPWKPVVRGREEWKGFDPAPMVAALRGIKGKALVSYQGALDLGKGWSKATVTRSQFGSDQVSKQDLWSNYRTKRTKIQIPIEAGDERLAAAVTRLAGAIGIQTEREARVGLESPEADRFVSGELDLLAAARKGLPVGRAIDLIKDGEVIGVAELGKPEQVDLWRFAELTARHGVNDELRRERWPQAKKLFAYPIVKAEARDPGYVEIELAQDEAAALDAARRLAELWNDSMEGFVRRQAMFLEAMDDEQSKRTLAFVRGLPDVASDLMGALKAISGSVGKAERASSAVVIGRELLKALQVIAPRLPASKSKDVIDRAVKALTELDRLSREEFLREGGHVPEAQEKRVTAPVHPSGEKTGKEITLEDVLPHLKPAILRRNAVTLVGGLANWGKSRNDVDLLIKGPIDEGLRRVMQFRIGRMVPTGVSQRIQFLDDDELGGPFTDHVELFDLWLVPRTHQVVEGGAAFEKIEMRDVSKADDPLMDLPSKRGKRPAVYQYHFRGKSLHGDLRIQVNDQLVGWTLAPAKADKVPSVVEVNEARRFARRFDRDGSFFEKDWTAPEGLFATPKSRMPRSWLDIDGEKFEPGEIGATANEPGVIVRVTDPALRVEYGIQKPWAHEYFFTGDSKFSGRLFFRQLTGRGGDTSDEESGRRTPAGETFWRSFWTKDLLPSVLNRRSVQRGTMPPDGYSALPLSLEAVVPAEFRYWEHKGSKARELRDALVDAKILTADNIKIVDGEFRRVVTKTYLDLSAPTIEPTIKRNLVRYGLGWQFWKGQQVVRAGPSRQLWHLVVARDDGKFDAWKLSTDPTSGEDRISGVHRVIDDPALMTYNGDVKPGQRIGGEVLNDSKATPSWIRNVDSGKAELIESSDGVRKLRFRGKLRGTYSLNREEDGSDFWLMELEESATKGRSAGASLFAKRAGRLCFVECPACGAVNLRLNGLRKLDDGSAAESVECNECSALFGIRGEVIDRNTIEDPVDDLDNAPGDDRDYIVIKAVPVRDGVQVWDPERNDPNADRTQLRPLAIYQPMKVPPRETNEFRDIGDLVKRFATPTLLEMGILVEPKYNGFRISLQKRGNKTLIFTEDEKRDLSAVLPGLVKELRSLPGDFVLDGEGMALDADGNFIPRRDLAQFRGKDPVDDASLRIPIFDALYTDGTNLTEKVQTDRRRRVERLLRGKHERFFAAPGKIARTRGELEAAVDWARKQPGSEGAMLKGVEATYSLGGENDLWAKYKASRRLRAIVYAKDPVKDSPGVWTYFGAIGPVSAKDAERWTETVEVKGQRWVPVGKTFNSKEKLEIGDAIEVEATEVLLDRSGEKDRIRWFTPTVIGPAEKPMSVGEVESMLRPDEIKKLVRDALAKRIPLIKTGEERFVLGVVLEPNDGSNGAPLDPDSQRDIYSAEEIRQAAHKFMEEYRNLGVMHSELANDKIKILESYICPADVTIGGQKVRKGTWLLAVRIVDDTLWQRVKGGELTGFSIGGSAMRSPVRR